MLRELEFGASMSKWRDGRKDQQGVTDIDGHPTLIF